MKISAVVPVYNSGKILWDSYNNIKRELEKITSDYEILFRNDGSKDRSEAVLKEISEKDKKVRIFSNPIGKGLGFTLAKLFKDALGEFIVYLDADAYLCFDLSKLSDFLKIMQNDADVVIASRYKNKNNRIPVYRIYPSRAYNMVTRLLFRINIQDIGSGFVFFRKKILENINIESHGFDVHVELFAKIKRLGFKIKEVPISYEHWYGGSFNLLKHGPITFLKTLNLWLKIMLNK